MFVGLLPDAGGMLTGLAVLVSLAAQASSGLDPVEWPLRPAPPSRSERHCTDYSRMFWSVSLDGGVPRTEQLITREHVDPLPFAYAEGRDRQGSRYVARVAGTWLGLPTAGWLASMRASSAAVFGGSASEMGTRAGGSARAHRRRPTPMTRFVRRTFWDCRRFGTTQLVLMGLDHLGGRSGRIFRAVPTQGGWALESVAVLDSQPDAWLVDDSQLFFLTESGLWESDGTAARRVHATELGDHAPTSIVRAADGAFYVGLRYYVLRLAERDGEWEESWFIPASCQKVQLRDYTCECLP